MKLIQCGLVIICLKEVKVSSSLPGSFLVEFKKQSYFSEHGSIVVKLLFCFLEFHSQHCIILLEEFRMLGHLTSMEYYKRNTWFMIPLRILPTDQL